jgi:hypothetical protein
MLSLRSIWRGADPNAGGISGDPRKILRAEVLRNDAAPGVPVSTQTTIEGEATYAARRR